MLCAKYDYKTDIAVQREEAFEDGLENGYQKKAVEAARNFLKENIPAETIAKCINLSLEDVLKLKEESSELTNH